MNSAEESSVEPSTIRSLIGIGASAGGLEALEAFLDTAPDDADNAYVVITHLSPNFKSLMDELLSRHTRMRVQLVEDGVHIRPNQVYVIPPNSEMIVVSGRLLLSDRDPSPHLSLPIDTFFNSMARDFGERAVAVVLSGTGGDGSHALNAVREAGGRVYVQDPETAKFDGMPRAAINTGLANDVLAPAEIGQRLAEHLEADGQQFAEALPADPDGEALQKIFAALFGSSSIDFEAYKTTTVLRRIDRRIAARKCDSIRHYADLIEHDPTEADNLSRDLLIGVTQFFRDEEAFRHLATEIVPQLVRDTEGKRPIRVWCAGCATGEEAYTIAMLLRRELDEQNSPSEVQIFATDLQREFIDHAGRGVFPRKSFPDAWQPYWERYTFVYAPDQLQVSPDVRRMVVFAHHNILSDPPFTRLDMVTCRNLLIYLQPEAQERVLGMVSFGLRRKGFLFLGPSESLGDLEQSYAMLNKRWRIYRKESDLAALHVPQRNTAAGIVGRTPTPMPSPRRTERREAQLMPAYAAMLDRFAPPGVLIDGDRQLVHTFGAARQFLRPPEGLISLNIIDMAPEGLRLPLATAIDRVNRDGKEVTFEGASDGARVIDLTVFAVAPDVEGRRGHKVVLLRPREDASTEDGRAAREVLTADSIALARIEDLEGELRYTRENLQATIEEVETSNEELQSTNEELMAANEELQSTNEELHSVNEELFSVNSEYQRKNDELVQLNRDMEALMAATDVGVIFVDENLMIRRFTEPVKRLFNLIDEDKGRSLTHMTHRMKEIDIATIARRSVEHFASSEHEVDGETGEHWLLRCMPMRTPGSSAIGAILTAIDITDQKRATEKAEKEAWRNGLITEIGNAFVVTSDAQFNIAERAPGWETYTGQAFGEYRGLGWISAIHPDDRSRVTLANQESNGDTGGEAHEVLYRLYNEESGEFRHCQAHVMPETSPTGTLIGWTGVLVDVEDAVQSSQAVRRSEQLIRSIMDDMPGLFAMLDTDRCYVFVNSVYEERWGGGKSLLGEKVEDILSEDILAEVRPHLDAAYQGETQEFMFERRNTDGDLEVILGVYAPTFNEDGAVTGVSVFAQDVLNALSGLKSRENLEEALGRILIEGTGEYLVVDSDSLTILRNSRGAAVNLKRQTIELTRMRLPDILPEYDQVGLEKLIGGLMERDPPTLQLDTFVARGDGTTYDAEVTVEMRADDDDRRLVVSIHDLSSQHAVRHALRAQNEELARSNSDLESFAYFASHDLQEPARKIGNFAELIAQDLGEKLTDDGRQYLEIIQRAADRMLTLVQDLLDFSRIRAVEEKFQPVELNELVAGVMEDLKPDLSQHQAAVDVSDLPTINGDPVLMSQLFSNLIGNAIKYRDQKRQLEIKVSATVENGEHVIAVSDNGIGFAISKDDEIFGLFRRLHGPATIVGSGVGLAICKRVAELHRGQIEARSEPGKGATFTLRLPT